MQPPKPFETRDRGAETLLFQVAAIPYRGAGRTLEVLLVTTSKRKRWIAPKGVIEPGETPGDVATREAFEEAGVRGRIWTHPIGTYFRKKKGTLSRIEVYPLEVEAVSDRWPEDLFRSRQWLPIEKAIERAGHDGLRAILCRLGIVLAESRPSLFHGAAETSSPKKGASYPRARETAPLRVLGCCGATRGSS